MLTWPMRQEWESSTPYISTHCKTPHGTWLRLHGWRESSCYLYNHFMRSIRFYKQAGFNLISLHSCKSTIYSSISIVSNIPSHPIPSRLPPLLWELETRPAPRDSVFASMGEMRHWIFLSYPILLSLLLRYEPVGLELWCGVVWKGRVID